MIRRMISLLCVLALLMTGFPARAGVIVAPESGASVFGEIPDTLTYQGGGVVQRRLPRSGGSNIELLELAYVLTSMPYIILGEETLWDVHISGGTGDYTCLVLLAHQDLSADPFGDGTWDVQDWFYLEGDSFEYTFEAEGRYMWEFRVMDDAGQTLTFHTRMYEAYNDEDETDATTVVGKVNSIVSELITPGMSDYSRALVLHDWLIRNATYDDTYTNYDAGGVLLLGTGVCDSYARAYLMLCTAAGLECMYVSGKGGSDENGWEDHGWNLVRLNGSWYHVDCTWDDPGEGDGVQYTYFCVDDETMAVDHRWDREDDLANNLGYLTPAAEGGQYEPSDEERYGDYDFTFSTWDEYTAEVDKLVAAGEFRSEIIGLYTGDLSIAEMWAGMQTPISQKAQELGGQGLLTGASLACSGNLFKFQPTWVNPSSYIRIDETTLWMSVGEQTVLVPSEYTPEEDAFTWTIDDSSVATVTPQYGEDGPTAIVTALSTGTAQITVTSDDGLSDSLTVTVLPPLKPDMALAVEEADGELHLTWEAVPGATEYRIYIDDYQLTVVTNTEISVIGNAQERWELYVVGARVVGGEDVFTYRSESVFYGDLSIEYTISLPAALTVIADDAFMGDTTLTAVYIPDGVTSIGKNAFAGCTSLTAIRIPGNLQDIGENAFDGCPLEFVETPVGSPAALKLTELFPEIEIIG